ncbi:MAG: hypothetical protein RIS47_154 [Bacteroidota bacterium]|jgi:hypothetical protein
MKIFVAYFIALIASLVAYIFSGTILESSYLLPSIFSASLYMVLVSALGFVRERSKKTLEISLFVALSYLIWIGLVVLLYRGYWEINVVFVQTFIGYSIVLNARLCAESLLKYRSASSSFRSFSSSQLHLIWVWLLFSGFVATIAYLQNPNLSANEFLNAFSSFALAGLGISVGMQERTERKLIGLLHQLPVSVYYKGNKLDKRVSGLLEQIQSVRTIAFQKANLLSDGKYVMSALDHKSTILRNTVLNNFYNLFLLYKPEMATCIEPLIEKKHDEKFESVEVSDNKVTVANEFGVKMTLGEYEVAESLTSDDSYSYYLVRGNTLYARLLFADNANEGLDFWIKKFNQKPLNTVIVSSESLSSCESLASQLDIDKAYAPLSVEEQNDILRRLNEKAPTASIAQGTDKTQLTISFEPITAIHSRTLDAVWNYFEQAKKMHLTVRNIYIFKWLYAFVAAALILVFGLNIVESLLLAQGYWLVSIVWFAISGRKAAQKIKASVAYRD